MENKKDIVPTIIGVVVVILIIVALVYFNSKSNEGSGNTGTSTATSTISLATSTTDTAMDTFAKCVAKTGLTMYGAAWCSHCQNEKKGFGESFKYVPYVECPDNTKLCEDKGIVGFPTWIDASGKKYEGEQGLVNIAKITGCELLK